MSKDVEKEVVKKLASQMIKKGSMYPDQKNLVTFSYIIMIAFILVLSAFYVGWQYGYEQAKLLQLVKQATASV